MWRYINQKLALRQMGVGEVRLKMDKIRTERIKKKNTGIKKKN